MKKCGNLNHESCAPRIPLEADGDVKHWEEARCSVCMEHPHNAVILRCSSYDNGCRPFMCNTSYRHSNCLDQFCKSSVSCPSTLTIEGGIPRSEANSDMNGLLDLDFDFEGIFSPGANSDMNELEDLDFGGIFSSGENSDMNELEDLDYEENKLTCPLCRGEVHGWFVVDAAREFMNAKTRSCSCEDCDFSGNYVELRKHARSVHPTVRPSEVDPERQRNWDMMEHESNIQWLINLIREVVQADVDVRFGGVQNGDAEIELEWPSFIDFEEIPLLELRSVVEGFRNIYASVANDNEMYDHFVSTFAEISRRNRNNNESNNDSSVLNSRDNNDSSVLNFRDNNEVRNRNNDVARADPLERTSSNQNRNSYRLENSANIYTGQNNDFTAVVVETVFRNQNDSEENNITDINSGQNNGFNANAVERASRNWNNCGEGNTNDLNSGQSNDFKVDVSERACRNQNNRGVNNTNDRNSVQNNDYSANMTERVHMNRNNQGENNTNYLSSRQNNDFSANMTQNIRRNQRRHEDHISGFNYISNTRLNNPNSRHNIFEGNRNERRQRWIDNSRHGNNVNRRPSNRR